MSNDRVLEYPSDQKVELKNPLYAGHFPLRFVINFLIAFKIEVVLSNTNIQVVLNGLILTTHKSHVLKSLRVRTLKSI